MFAKWIETDGRFSFDCVDNGGVEISDEAHAELFAGVDAFARQGIPKIIVADGEGNPTIGDPPPLTAEQRIAEAEGLRDELLREAALRIEPLQDAVDLEVATEAEALRLKSWKTYRVALVRCDLAALPILWPTKPE